MTKATLLFVSLFITLAVVLTYVAVAQQAAKVQPPTQVKAATATPAKATGPMLPKVAKVTVNDPVTLTDNGDTWTLDNGILKATIVKKNGSLLQVVYHGIETLRPSISRGSDNLHSPPTPSGSPIPSWEQMPAGTVTASVTIDPAKNGGARAEVAVKGINPGGGGAPGGGAPDGGARGGGASGGGARGGSAPGGGAPGALGGGGGGRGGGMDIETRYTMERGVSGIYAYAEFSHPASYPAAHVGESQIILQLDPSFNWFSVDADRNMLTPATEDMRAGIMVHAPEQTILKSGLYKNSVEHKYTYSGVMYQHPAWGFSSPKDHIGVYVINPSTEYIGGGAEKLDLNGPYAWGSNNTIQIYWTSGHYGGGANTDIAAGEDWNRVVGPIFVYFNAVDHPKDPTQADLDKVTASYGSGTLAVPKVWHDNAIALWNDAMVKATTVKAAWPFDWVAGMDYPRKAERGTVMGQLVLDDPQATSKSLPNLTVGLTHANYTGSGSGFQLRPGNGNIVTWPHDGNYYEFWVDGSADGRFTIPNVRPGTYVLRAFAKGVLGEYDRTAKVTVEAGKKIDLGKIDWKPVRYGKQVWEIGYPDRTADKFFKGDGANYWLWGWGLRYSGLFPNDITYTIGKSDYRKDWFFQEVPHSTTTGWLNPAAKDPYNQHFGWVNIPATTADPWPQWGRGRATTWTVKFNIAKASQGSAVLRIALAGADGTTLAIGVNGQTVGTIRPVATNALRYNTNKGVWNQYIQKFDASLMKAGENEMTFTVPAGDVTSGVVWDYVRLELNDGGKTYPAPPDNPRPDYPTLE
jgi:rhamnogalacturonan endolyase